MNQQLSSVAKLSTMDLVISVMDSQQSSLDFTLVFHLAKGLDLEDLRRGAKSARNLYPATGSYIDGKEWTRFGELKDRVEAASSSSCAETRKVIEEFVDAPLNLRKQMPVRQLVITHDKGPEIELVTRFHHAVADGVSAAMWLTHQLAVAYGQEDPLIEAAPFEQLRLRTHSSPVRRNSSAFVGPSDRLWTSGAQRTGARRWLTIDFAVAGLRKHCRQMGGFTYNDLLATCALEVFTRWNRIHGANQRQKIGLWLPIDIRKRSLVGFGNGTSRIRLYARYPKTDSLADKCREIRRQVSWANLNGEWVVPEVHPITRFPRWAVNPLLRLYLNRPSADMGTGVFSHAERWPGSNSAVLKKLERIECIGLLHRGQSVAINGATDQGRTWLTFTYDPGLLFASDIQQLADMYQEQIARAYRA